MVDWQRVELKVLEAITELGAGQKHIIEKLDDQKEINKSLFKENKILFAENKRIEKKISDQTEKFSSIKKDFGYIKKGIAIIGTSILGIIIYVIKGFIK